MLVFNFYKYYMEILNEMIRYPSQSTGWTRLSNTERNTVKNAMLKGKFTYHSVTGDYRHKNEITQYTHQFALDAMKYAPVDKWNLTPFAYSYVPGKGGCYQALALVDNLLIQVVSYFCPPLSLASKIFDNKLSEKEIRLANIANMAAKAAKNSIEAKKDTITAEIKHNIHPGMNQDPRNILDISNCYVLYLNNEFSTLEKGYQDIIDILGRDAYNAAKMNSIKVITNASRGVFNQNNSSNEDETTNESTKYTSFANYIKYLTEN